MACPLSECAPQPTNPSRIIVRELLKRRGTGQDHCYQALVSPRSQLPRTNQRDPPTATVSAANHTTVIRWLGGTLKSRTRLSNPMEEIVRLRKRNTGAVKSAESFNSVATSTGVFRFLNSSARAGRISPVEQHGQEENSEGGRE